ncbi:MAG: adenine phosphoribosyltransferase [Gammaproteobacteria bacterium]
MEILKSKIAAVDDFPQPGIVFRDITPLLMDPDAIKLATHSLVEPFRGRNITAVAGMEARGFIFGALAAQELGSGFIPLRKPGKLPREIETMSYDLEYGSATLEVHADAANTGDRVLLVDDLIATGGTAAASCALLEQLGAEVAACAFVIELDALQGRTKLEGREIHSLVHY